DLTPLIEHLITAEPADLIEPWRPLLAPEAKPEPLTALIDPAPRLLEPAPRLLEPAPRLLEPAPLRALDASPPRPLRPRADARPSASAKAPSTQAPSTQAPSTQPLSRATPRRAPPRRFDLLAIGVSTGGPKALADLFSGLSVPLPTPVLIVQHMPAHFTRSLAERLDRLGPMRAREAQEGDLLEPGLALIAPGGRHMEINRRGEVRLSDAPPVKGCRPSVDVLLSSLAHAYDGALLTLILTGMGDDGADGLRALGGAYYGLAQDAASCVVYGMPRAAVEAGLIDEIHPLDHLPARLQELLRSR
ncbi:hypothetical protein KKF91_18645, partial [Myxococcota bacterium]|nr:hypothetical protein [Myxococcota bacterium]